MRQEAIHEIDVLVERYPQLENQYNSLVESVNLLANTYCGTKKVLVCGNGGSAADSLHIVGELMKCFVVKRALPNELKCKLREDHPEQADLYLRCLEGALPAISLVNEVSLMTAFGNDQAAELVFAQQVLGYGQEGDALIAISTSGNSANVLHAARIAKSMGLKVLGLTGEGGGKLKALCDVLIEAPSNITYQIQEFHLPIYHALCLALEQEFYAKSNEEKFEI